MEAVVLEFTNSEARYIASFLRRRYNKDKRTRFSRLCEIAVRCEVARQANEELSEGEEAEDDNYA